MHNYCEISRESLHCFCNITTKWSVLKFFFNDSFLNHYFSISPNKEHFEVPGICHG